MAVRQCPQGSEQPHYSGLASPEARRLKIGFAEYATHLFLFEYNLTSAWRVETREDLLACRAKVEAAGIELKYQIRHEVIESIYFNDPNGYSLEITWQVRPFTKVDVADATRTLEAAIALENASRSGNGTFTAIDEVWRSKGERLAADLEVQ